MFPPRPELRSFAECKERLSRRALRALQVKRMAIKPDVCATVNGKRYFNGLYPRWKRHSAGVGVFGIEGRCSYYRNTNNLCAIWNAICAANADTEYGIREPANRYKAGKRHTQQAPAKQAKVYRALVIGEQLHFRLADAGKFGVDVCQHEK